MFFPFNNLSAAITDIFSTMDSNDMAAFTRKVVGANFPISGGDKQINAVQFNQHNTGTLYPHICYGNIDDAVEAADALDNCLHLNDEDLVPLCTFSGGDNATSTCYLDRTYTIGNGDYYVLLEGVDTIEAHDQVGAHYATHNHSADSELFGIDYLGLGYYYSNFDLEFAIVWDDSYAAPPSEDEVEVIENPDYDPDMIVEVTFEDDLDISDKDCLIGEDCLWKFGYNLKYDNGYAYLVPDQNPRERASAVSSTTLGYKFIRTDYFEPPEPANPQTDEYCVFLETDATYLYLSCGHKVHWYDEFEADQMAIEECVSTACSDVASTSPWWDPDIEGAITCALRKFTCWAMTPSTATKMEFKELQTEVRSNFPFSIYEQIKGIFYEAGATVSTTSKVTIVPLKWYDSGTGQYEEVGALLTNKTAEEGMGDVYETYYDWFERIIWIIFFVYCLNRILLLINPQATSLFDIMPKKKKYDSTDRGNDRPLAN